MSFARYTSAIPPAPWRDAEPEVQSVRRGALRQRDDRRSLPKPVPLATRRIYSLRRKPWLTLFASVTAPVMAPSTLLLAANVP